MFCCHYCSHYVKSFKKLLTHIRFTHSHEPNFSITCGDCAKSFKKFTAFKSHIRRKHENAETITLEVQQNNQLDNEDVVNEFDDGEEVEQLQAAPRLDKDDSVENLTRFLALFILKTKETNQLSQQAMNAIIANTEDIVEHSLNAVKSKVVCCLGENGIQPEEVPGLDDIFYQQSEFSKACEMLKTEYYQIKYFVENFHLIVSTVY